MKRAELLELIAGGENSGVEFKRDDLRPEQLAREVVALANFQGGDASCSEWKTTAPSPASGETISNSG